MKRRKENRWLLVSCLLLMIGCSNNSCDKEISDYFQVEEMNVYSSTLEEASAYNDQESFMKTIKVDSANQSNLKIIGQFDVSDFGLLGDECEGFYGSLGAEKQTTQLKIVDLISSTDLTNQCYLSEVELLQNLKYEDSFNVYYNYYQPTDVINTSIDSLNNMEYRMSLPNFLIGFTTPLDKGNYMLEITYSLETKEFVSVVSFSIE